MRRRLPPNFDPGREDALVEYRIGENGEFIQTNMIVRPTRADLIIVDDAEFIEPQGPVRQRMTEWFDEYLNNQLIHSLNCTCAMATEPQEPLTLERLEEMMEHLPRYEPRNVMYSIPDPLDYVRHNNLLVRNEQHSELFRESENRLWEAMFERALPRLGDQSLHTLAFNQPMMLGIDDGESDRDAIDRMHTVDADVAHRFQYPENHHVNDGRSDYRYTNMGDELTMLEADMASLLEQTAYLDEEDYEG